MDINNEQLKLISDLAHRQVREEREVADLTASLKLATEKLRYVQEVLLPNAMQEAGFSEFTLDSGEGIEIKRDIHASISEERFPIAKAWLQENGYDGIIKHVVSLSFGKGENDAAEKAVTALVAEGFTPSDKESIHHSTLKATMKELLGNGVDVPMEVFGIHEVVKAKVSVK